MMSGGCVPGGSPRSRVCDMAVICAFAVWRLAVGCKYTLMMVVPLMVVDSMCWMLSTVVVRVRSNTVVIRPSISSGLRPV